ncbi:MAG: ComEA family DNA-binding protein [Chloroflexales bacterium]|nr:ComEA family DNA-binding protein [Chloroflexales bacterium]
MIRRLFWLSAAAGVGYAGYMVWRWAREQNKPSSYLNDALAGRLYEPQPAGASAAGANVSAKRPASAPGAEAPAQPRRIVTRVHRGAPPAAAPAVPATPEQPEAPAGEGLAFGPVIVGADTTAEADTAADQSSPVSSEAAEGEAPIPSGEITNLNSADEDALIALPGIGPALARRIIAYRDEQGPFTSIDQLEAIQGIGPRNIDEFRHLVTI